MTLSEFQSLAEAKQINLLYKEGVYIGKRKERGTSIVLYQLDSFYIEVIYKIYRHSVAHLRCFNSTTGLNPYLTQISVEELMHL